MICAETSTLLAKIPNVRHGFFTRHGGVSESPFTSLNCSLNVGDDPRNVEANRKNILAHLLPHEQSSLFLPTLNHGNNVHCLSEPFGTDPSLLKPADAAITKTTNIALAVTYADCLPLLLSSRDGTEIAVAHAGWRGIYSSVIGNTLALMQSRPEEVIAAIGPCISGTGFLVSKDLFQQFSVRYPFATSHNAENYRIDLLKIAVHQLETLGVRSIEKVGHFTDLNTDKYFSYRKEQGNTGRMMAVITIIRE